MDNPNSERKYDWQSMVRLRLRRSTEDRELEAMIRQLKERLRNVASHSLLVNDKGEIVHKTLELESLIVLIDETRVLSKLTKWLVVFTIVLAILTGLAILRNSLA